MTTTPELFRAHAMAHGLSREELKADSFLQFQDWFEAAIATGTPEPNGLSLATVDEVGQPWLHTVLLKLYDERGFVFFTNYESRKTRQIGGNPQVALLFPWVALARQVKINGRAERIATRESLAYFLTRPRGSQIGAWASHQSQVIQSLMLVLSVVGVRGPTALATAWRGAGQAGR